MYACGHEYAKGVRLIVGDKKDQAQRRSHLRSFFVPSVTSALAAIMYLTSA